MHGEEVPVKARYVDSEGGLIFYEGQKTSLKPVKIQQGRVLTDLGRLHPIDLYVL